MKKRYLAGLAILASISVLASHANAGADMIIDNSAQAPPPPAYGYAPPPVYYVPPPPPIVVYPAVGFYRPVRAFGYRPWYGHRGYRGGHHWR